MAPIHLSCKDTWGWGSSGVYSAASGFKAIQTSSQTSLPPSFGSLNAACWKMVMNSPIIPKVNIFTWTIMHQKVLTGENLLKQGFLGPYRCRFCLQSTETSAHIFVGCVFAQEVWEHFMCGFPSCVPLNSDPAIIFKRWHSRYHVSSII